MPRIKIRQLDERVATNGLHMGGGPERRKLEPHEVIDLDEDFALPDGTLLLEGLWATKKIEMTLDPVTRPLDYESYREAMLCSPTFKPRDPSDEQEMLKARAAVAARLESVSEAPITTDSPADDVLDTEPDPTPAVEAIPPTAKNRRAERRAALQAAQRGAAISS